MKYWLSAFTKILLFSVVVIAAVSAVSAGLSLLMSAGFNLRHVIIPNYVVGVIVTLMGFSGFNIPYSSWGLLSGTDQALYNQRIADKRSGKIREINRFIYMGLIIVAITGLAEFLLSFAY